MAATPQFKVFNAEGEYVASVKYFEDAACLMSFYGEGASVRAGHGKKETLWTEGRESFSAGESYDDAAEVMASRLADLKNRTAA